MILGIFFEVSAMLKQWVMSIFYLMLGKQIVNCFVSDRMRLAIKRFRVRFAGRDKISWFSLKKNIGKPVSTLKYTDN